MFHLFVLKSNMDSATRTFNISTTFSFREGITQTIRVSKIIMYTQIPPIS